MSKLKAVFWDIDNTLVNSSCALNEARRAAVAAMADGGLPVSNIDEGLQRLQVLEDYFNGTWYHSIFLVLGIEYGVARQRDRDSIASLGTRAFDEQLERIAPLPGVRNTLERLREAGIGLGTISNALARIQQFKLAKANLLEYFAPELTFISSDAIDRHQLFSDGYSSFHTLSAYVEGSSLYRVEKPWPVMFEMASRATGLAPDRMAFVGDMLTDVVGANAAGFVSILLRDPQAVSSHVPVLRLEKPDFMISRAEQVLDIVRL